MLRHSEFTVQEQSVVLTMTGIQITFLRMITSGDNLERLFMIGSLYLGFCPRPLVKKRNVSITQVNLSVHTIPVPFVQ